MAISTITTLVSSPNPARLGVSVHYQATVTPGSGGTPTGTVQFYDNAVSLGSPVALSGGVADLFQTYTTVGDVGNHSITATYIPDLSWQASASSPVIQTILKYANTTTVTSSLAPSQYEDQVTFTAVVDGVTVSPTGTVVFYDGITLLGSTGTTLGVAPVSTAQYTTNALTPGTHNITAVYSGDSLYDTSTSVVFLQQVTAVIVAPNTLPSFALIASYSTQGDVNLPAAASLTSVPQTASPGQSVTLLWATTSVAAVQIIGNNGIDPHFDTGILTTQGTGAYVWGNGWTHTITLVMTCFDRLGNVLGVSAQTIVTIA